MEPEWWIGKAPVAYEEAIAKMERRAQAIREGEERELVWLLEHPPLYTAGTSAVDSELLLPDRLPIHRTGRGGRFTYHGPGQRVGYLLLDLKKRECDVRAFVRNVEDWIIGALAAFNITGVRRQGRVGIWIERGKGREDKIAAIGIRIRRWVSYHGMAINIDPDLSHYEGIIPCGIEGHGVTSLADLGVTVTMAEVDAALKASFRKVFAAS
jgi:lipoyl(octanoyl) transferase